MGEYLFIASAILSVANGIVLLCVNPHRLVNKIFFGSSGWIAIWCICVAMAIREGAEIHDGPNVALIFWLRMSSAVAAYLGWFLSMMNAALINESTNVWNAVRRSWFWLIIAIAGIFLAFSETFIPSASEPLQEKRGIGYVAYIALMVTGCLTILAISWRNMRTLNGIRKIEMQFFVLSFACACLLALGSSSIGRFFEIPWLRRLVPAWVLGLHGITVWAVSHYRVFDAKQLLLSVGQRLLLLSFLGFLAVKLDQIVDQVVHGPWGPFFTAIVVCATGIACDGPTRRWFGLDSAHLLLVPRRMIIEWARKVPDEEELKEKFEQLLHDQCQTNSAILLSLRGNSFSGQLDLPVNWVGFVALCKEGWTTPETLQRSRSAEGTLECAEFMSLHQLGALLAVPKGSFPPSLVIGLGQKASLRPYTFPDTQDLLALAELMDNILTHSRVSAHAARIEKMASATMMSRGLAHDLNNLATPVSTFLHHMDGKVTANTPEAEVLTAAKHSLNVMQDYIQESLFFARQLIPHFSPVDAHELLASILRLSHERAAAASVRVVLSGEENFTFVADEALLKRLLQNLVFNSLDASQPGESIEVSASIAEGNQVSLRVTDHGQGIAPEIRDHIFEPYFTTKNSGNEHRGFGLGLAICQKIAELHGGKIVVSPDTVRGSVFTVLIPKGDALKVISAAAVDRSAIRAQPSHGTISSLASIGTMNGY